jgi:hypothetical protein
MSPKPREIYPGDQQEINLKYGAKQNRACILEYKMKNEAGNK